MLMFKKKSVQKGLRADLEGKLAAIDKSQAVIEFDLHGTILAANENFLHLIGYRLEEVQGQNHSMLVDPRYRTSEEYRRFWENLRRGECQIGQYPRVGKGGREIWLHASYNPVFNAGGKPCKVLKLASDVTAQVSVTQQMQSAVTQTEDVIKSAIGGDLSRRVRTVGTCGDVLKMAEAINLLLGTVSDTFADVQEVIMAATEGHLSGRVESSAKTGDLRKMAESVNVLLESVALIVSNVKGAASEVLGGAEEISQGTLDLQERTEQQASSLEQTASSMEEMTHTVKQNADNAAQANQLATAARDQAEKGGAVVGKAIDAMARINEASKKIADIIGVIDELAFQTNLLALNAAVEAARAGEQGRGFAVVATEVRSLAGRSATAAKEIKELIQDSVRKVGDGSLLVTQSGQTLEQIVMSVKKVSDIVAEIAAASREQSLGIEQVGRAVMQMDELTQQNAALVEQATAASQAMTTEAGGLNEMMAHYDFTGVSTGSNGTSYATVHSPAVTSDATPRADAPTDKKLATSGATSRAERRKATRPWVNQANRKPASAAPRPEAAVAPATRLPVRAESGKDSSEWQEF